MIIYQYNTNIYLLMQGVFPAKTHGYGEAYVIFASGFAQKQHN